MMTSLTQDGKPSERLIEVMCDFIEEDDIELTFYNAKGEPVSFVERELERYMVQDAMP